MASDAWVIHDRFIEFKGDNTIDMDGDVFEVRAYTSASNVSDKTIGDATTLTNELSGNGYAAIVLTTTWIRAGSITTFDAADEAFLASGGPLTARFYAIVDTTTTPDEVVAHALLDNTPADVSAPDGETLNVGFPTTGIFQESN